jgi:hypothetical protein
MMSKELEFISVDQDDDDEAQYGMDQAYGQAAVSGSSSTLSSIESALGSSFFSQSKVCPLHLLTSHSCSIQ